MNQSEAEEERKRRGIPLSSTDPRFSQLTPEEREIWFNSRTYRIDELPHEIVERSERKAKIIERAQKLAEEYGGSVR